MLEESCPPWRWMAVLLCAAAGCSIVPHQEPATPPPPGPGDTVFVADGAGDFRMMSAAVRRLSAEAGLSLRVETFVWSHGYLKLAADQMDKDNLRAQGRRLADLVIARRREFPESAVFLVGHSAGGAVVLAAAEFLPPESVYRVILLAPSVPADYDLRGALRAAREGIDVHCSSSDTRELGTITRTLNALQGEWAPPAGMRGFRPACHAAEGGTPYAKLRHFPWDPSLEAWTDHDGGHYGCYQPNYMRNLILPRLARGAADK